MAKKARGIIVYEVIQVYVNTNIRELTEAIQESVKKIIYATTGVNVIDVNIKVKNVYNGKRKEETEKQEKVEEKEETIDSSKEITVEEKVEAKPEVEEASEAPAPTEEEAGDTTVKEEEKKDN